ncbi:DUF4179 domain-containing protein [Blautia schinkii]|nr:DUF4179 domain-containing protein [Blautia schinkii]
MNEREKMIRKQSGEAELCKGDILNVLQQDIIIPDIVQKKAASAFEMIRQQANEEKGKNTAGKRTEGKSFVEKSIAEKSLVEKSITDKIIAEKSIVRRKTASQSVRKRKKKIGILLCAAVLAAGAVTAGAAAYMNWTRSLSEGMQASDEMQRNLEDAKMVAPVNKTSVCNGITVTAEQSIVDNYYAQIIFRVEGYEVPEGEQPSFEDLSVTLDGYDPVRNFGTADYDEKKDFRSLGVFYNGLIADENGRPLRADGSVPTETETLSEYVMDDGSMEYQVTLSNSRQKGIFFYKAIHIEMENLGTVAKATYFPDLEGTWTFDWVLTGSDEMKVWDLDAPVGDTGVTVKHVELSPISINVTYNLPRKILQENRAAGNPVMGAYPFDMPGVKMKDGTLYPMLYLGPGSMGYMSEESDDYFTAFPIDRILDVSQVEALIIKNVSENEDAGENKYHVIPLE